MIQTNNADLGKAFPGGMEDMVPGKASFLPFGPGLYPLLTCVLLMDSCWDRCYLVQPFPAIGRLTRGQVGLAKMPGFPLCWNSRYVDRRLA